MTENHSNARASSSSSLNSSLPDTEDDHTIAALLAAEEENSLKPDTRLGKRLSHLDSIPHTPRINGEIPDVNDATLDHERLSERLATYGLAELQIEGDGNCQFRALADQLFRNPDYHKHVRKQIIKQLKHFKKLYEGYVPMNYKSYVKKMKKSGEWGDHVTLQAAADRFGAKICLVTSFRDTCYIEIMPKDTNPTRELRHGIVTKCDDNDGEDLITKTCKKTPYEDLCLSTLQPISNSPNTDTKGLANFMATTVLKNATDTLNYIHGLIKEATDPQQERALAFCAELYIPVVKYELPQAIEALSKGHFGFAKYGISYVGNEADACEKRFSGSNKSPLTDRNELVRKLSDIAVAIINVLVN